MPTATGAIFVDVELGLHNANDVPVMFGIQYLSQRLLRQIAVTILLVTEQVTAWIALSVSGDLKE